jgi:hypothetical protein
MRTKDIPDRVVVEAFVAYRAQPQEPWESHLFADELLAEMTGAPIKVARRAIDRAMMRRLLDSGVSDRTGWPTKAGLALLAGAAHGT